MFDRIHQKLGTAGFVISIVALVAALGGGAYAASVVLAVLALAVIGTMTLLDRRREG